MRWYYPFDPVTGRLVSEADTDPRLNKDFPKELSVFVSPVRIDRENMWDEASMSVVSRPPPTVKDPLAGLKTDPDYQAVIAKLQPADVDQLNTAFTKQLQASDVAVAIDAGVGEAEVKP